MVVNRLATSATAGGHGAGVTVYANAHLLWILPHSLITVSLATAMLPNASRLAAAGDFGGVAAEFTKTVRLAMVAIVPATVAFLALSGPMAGLLFGHGTGATDAIWIALGADGVRGGADPLHRPVRVPAHVLRAGEHAHPVLAADPDRRPQHRRAPSRWCGGSIPTPGWRERWPWPTRWPTPSACSSRGRRCGAGCRTSTAGALVHAPGSAAAGRRHRRRGRLLPVGVADRGRAGPHRRPDRRAGRGRTGDPRRPSCWSARRSRSRSWAACRSWWGAGSGAAEGRGRTPSSPRRMTARRATTRCRPPSCRRCATT